MNASKDNARAEAIAGILRRAGFPHLIEFFIEESDIDVPTLRAIAGLAPAPVMTLDQLWAFEGLAH